MLERIFLLVLAISAAVMAAMTYYSWSWLQSIGAPSAAVDGYLNVAGNSWLFLIFTSLGLLVFANFILARSERSWPMWAAFVYFAAFVLIRYFFLERTFFNFRAEHGLTEAAISWAPFAGAVIVVVAGAVVFANQLLVVRLRERVYLKPPQAEPSESIEVEAEAVPAVEPDDDAITPAD